MPILILLIEGLRRVDFSNPVINGYNGHLYAILTTGLFLWLVYGFVLSDLPLILANGISFSLAMCVLLLKIRHG